jgi:hypothetical protein
LKKYLLVLILISSVILASGCTTSGNQTSGNIQDKTKIYSGEEITFEYPKGWETIASQGRDSIVAVGDPNSADGNGKTQINVVIQKTVKPQNSTFKDYYNATYAQFASQNMGFIPVSDGTLALNGVTAYENIYKINSGGQKQERAIWILKNNRIYIILCSAPVSEFNNQQANFDTIINSFKLL